MLVDSHAHLNFNAFDQDRDEVIARCQRRGMAVINVGSQLNTSQKAIAMAQEFSAPSGGFFAAVAIHPIHVGDYRRDPQESREHRSLAEMGLAEMFAAITELVADKKVVAIGETGLDYFHLENDFEKNKALQKEYFKKHIELAQKNNLPLILHCRGSKENPTDAYEDVLEVIKEKFKACPAFIAGACPAFIAGACPAFIAGACPANAGGVIHCFGADLDIARQFIDLGFYIGFTGIITFVKGAEALQAVAKSLPLSKILIETDCPYLAPEPFRGQRNEPIYVEYVAEKIAELKGLTVDEVVEQTGSNAERLFKLSENC